MMRLASETTRGVFLPRRALFSTVMLVAVASAPETVPAQTAALPWASVPPAISTNVPVDRSATPETHVICWYEALAVAGAVSTTFIVDEPLQRYFQRNRSSTSDDVASAFRHLGQPEVFGTLSLGLTGAGLIAHRPNLTRAGGRLAASVALSAAEFEVIKRLAGRARPDSGLGAFHFDPFSHSESLPSGHVAVAFTLAASLADDIHQPWATISLYTFATGSEFSRLNDNRHWLSDAALGAVLGVTTAKLVDGHWQVFGIHPPGFLLDPSEGGLAASFSF